MNPFRNYDEDDFRNLKLLVSFARANQLLTRDISNNLRKLNIIPSQFDVMEVLYHLGPQNINEIIEHTLSSSGNISLVVENLEKAGLVEKTVSHDDKRVRIIKLSKKGMDQMTERFPDYLENIARLWRHLSIEEQKQLRRLLKKLGSGLAADEKK